MESQLPESFLSFYESLLSAQLRVIRQLKAPKKKRRSKKEGGLSNMDMALDILRRARRPLHITEILVQIKSRHGVSLDRDSLVSALVKKVHQGQGVSRTAPNSFEAVAP